MHWQVQCNSVSSVSCKEIAASHLSFALLMLAQIQTKKKVNITACLPVSVHPSVLVGRLAGQVMILSVCADERHAKPHIGLSRIAMCLPIQKILARLKHSVAFAAGLSAKKYVYCPRLHVAYELM